MHAHTTPFVFTLPCPLTVGPPCEHFSRPTLSRPPHPVPALVTMANAPLLGTGWRECLALICPTG